MVRTKDRRVKQGSDQQVLAGIEQDLQSMPTMYLGKTEYTPATLSAFFQKRIDAINLVVTTKAAWQAAIAAYHTLDRQTALVTRDLRNLVIAAYGADSEKLQHFGFSPPKEREISEEAMRAAVLKRLATRKARGTLGPKQRAAITGETPATKETP
jgi:hypothetical protein